MNEQQAPGGAADIERDALPGGDQDVFNNLPSDLKCCLEQAERVILLANNPAITQEDVQALNIGPNDVVVSFNLCIHSGLLHRESVNVFVHGFNAPDCYFFGLPYKYDVQQLFTDPQAQCFTVLVGCALPLCPMPGVAAYWDRIPLPALWHYPVDRPGGKRYVGPSTGFNVLVLLDGLRGHAGYGYRMLTLGFSNESGKLRGGHAWEYERRWLLAADVESVPLKPRSWWRKLFHQR